MDQLHQILSNINFSAEVFFSGALCGIQSIGGKDTGHLHLLESGTLTVKTAEGHLVVMNRPSVIFLPSATEHQIIAEHSQDAKLVCASVKFDAAHESSLQNSLPQFIHMPITPNGPVGKTAHWLFDEAFEQRPGRQTMINNLSDIFILQILRHVLEEGLVLHGIFSAMSHPQLAKVMDAIHQQPENNWSLEGLASIAAMSRSKFAALFKETVGQPPNDYITDLRLAKAQNLLKDDKPINLVANQVGYEHGSALARIFRKKLGLSPREWLNSENDKL